MTTRDQAKARRKLNRLLGEQTSLAIAQEQADALSALGVPCVVRQGWVCLQDPDGLQARLSGPESAPGAPRGSEPENRTPETGDAQRGHGGPENGIPDLAAALRESIERARERRRAEPRPEFQALIDAFQPEYDALLKEDR